MSVKLSLEEGYDGLKRVSLLDSDNDYFWFQVVGGCGYDTTRMTATEARAVAQELNKMADKLEQRENPGGEQPAVEQRPRGTINIIFDGPPSHESGRFVEVENDAGESIRVGEWIDRGDTTWALVIRETTKQCTCHERDSSVTCPACHAEGYFGHMEQHLQEEWDAKHKE